MYPIKMNPVFKSYIWGGSRLKEKYGKNSPYDVTAESWEVAAHKNGESTAANGEYKGMTIAEITAVLKEKLLGDKVYKGDDTKFPLLVKFIDAKDNLSIQVHPNDEYANKNENGESGKTEMWYVLEAEPGAGLIYGFKHDITKEQFEKSIKDNTLLEYTNFVECKKGDCFFIPSGMLHAICKGLIIAEIQQNSDTTYRVYDYDRRDKDGNPRQLHVAKAVDVTNLHASKNSVNCDIKSGNLVKCDYFTTDKITVDGVHEYHVDKDRFEILILCEGEASVNGVPCKKGDSLLIPAYIGDVKIEGQGVFLRSFV